MLPSPATSPVPSRSRFPRTRSPACPFPGRSAFLGAARHRRDPPVPSPAPAGDARFASVLGRRRPGDAPQQAAAYGAWPAPEPGPAPHLSPETPVPQTSSAGKGGPAWKNLWLRGGGGSQAQGQERRALRERGSLRSPRPKDGTSPLSAQDARTPPRTGRESERSAPKPSSAQGRAALCCSPWFALPR